MAKQKVTNGQAVGDERDVVVPLAGGYGKADPGVFQMVPRDVFPAGIESRRRAVKPGRRWRPL